MKNIKQRFLCTGLAVSMALIAVPTPAFATNDYMDVPTDSWAVSAIQSAKDYGLMKGRDATHFGYGSPVTKAEFVTILCNLLKWNLNSPEASSFSDVKKESWYYSYVETALSHNVMDKSANFSPATPITREQAAVMFVRALGLNSAAKLEASSPLPFTDVTGNQGYISVARNIGMISGTSATTFAPTKTATREQIASMLTQVYTKYYGKTEFLHGFYAISSYSQKELTKDMDAVTLGWSTMMQDEKGTWLNTGSSDNNQYKIPDSYSSITSYLDSNQTKAHLGIYMDASKGAKELLTNANARTAAVETIISELTKNYSEIGKNPYSGITIDFEGLKGNEVKQGFNEFLIDLSTRLKAMNKTLYVAVQPALPGGVYFDGFDYKTIGSLADKVILMAHDYNPTSLRGYLNSEWYKNTAQTPIDQVYYSLKAITDPNTGVADHDKIVLAISFATIGWETSKTGKLISETPIHGSSEVVSSLLASPKTVKGFSQTYRNPYITYQTTGGKNIFLWYENDQSVFEKAALARLFGINGISLWRIGNIPNASSYDVTDSYQ